MNAHKSYKIKQNNYDRRVPPESPLDFKQKFLIYTYIFNRNV